MSETAESAVSTPAGRRVFTVGAILMILAGATIAISLPILDMYIGAEAPGYSLFAGMVLFSMSVILFATGVRGRGSVVGGRALGMIFLVVYAIGLLVPNVISIAQGFGPVGYFGVAWWPALIAGLVGTIEIGRIGAVPGGARWIPLAFLLLTAMWTVTILLFPVLGSSVMGLATILLMLVPPLVGIAPIVLGIVALRLAASARSQATLPPATTGDPTAALSSTPEAA